MTRRDLQTKLNCVCRVCEIINRSMAQWVDNKQALGMIGALAIPMAVKTEAPLPSFSLLFALT